MAGRIPFVTTTDDWRFFVSNDELGLLDGKWDLYTTYTYRERNISGGPTIGGSGPLGEGSFSIHEFSVEPLWVRFALRRCIYNDA